MNGAVVRLGPESLAFTDGPAQQFTIPVGSRRTRSTCLYNGPLIESVTPDSPDVRLREVWADVRAVPEHFPSWPVLAQR